jgi:hypothetical protein
LRVSLTGRVTTKTGVFDWDGYLRGERHAWHRTKARPATEDDIAGINRVALVSRLREFQAWEQLSPDELKVVDEIFGRYR